MLAALRLLRVALDCDAELVAAMRHATHSGAREGALAAWHNPKGLLHGGGGGPRCLPLTLPVAPCSPARPRPRPLLHRSQPPMRPWTRCCGTIAAASPLCWTWCGTLTTLRYRRRQSVSRRTCRVSARGACPGGRGRTPLGTLRPWPCLPACSPTPPLPRPAPPHAERIPNLVPLLLNSPPTGAVPAVQRLQDGFAACLQASLFNLAASVSLDEGGADADAGGAGAGGQAAAAALHSTPCAWCRRSGAPPRPCAATSPRRPAPLCPRACCSRGRGRGRGRRPARRARAAAAAVGPGAAGAKPHAPALWL